MKISVCIELRDNDGELSEPGELVDHEHLRCAVDMLFQTRTNENSGIEAINVSSSHIQDRDWISVHNGGEFRFPVSETRSLHIEGITLPSRKRLFKLLKGGY